MLCMRTKTECSRISEAYVLVTLIYCGLPYCSKVLPIPPRYQMGL